jgi:hypothetical protein
MTTYDAYYILFFYICILWLRHIVAVVSLPHVVNTQLYVFFCVSLVGASCLLLATHVLGDREASALMADTYLP